MRKVYPLSVLAYFLLAICAPAQPKVQPPSAHTDHRPVLVCFGDSLTAGRGIDPGQSYPDYLQALFDQRHIRYRVDNQGVSGNTTKDGVQRLPQVLALHPAVAVVEFGGNDGLRGLPIADTRANLDQIVATLRRHHDQGVAFTVDLLGEAVVSETEAGQYAQRCLGLASCWLPAAIASLRPQARGLPARVPAQPSSGSATNLPPISPASPSEKR